MNKTAVFTGFIALVIAAHAANAAIKQYTLNDLIGEQVSSYPTRIPEQTLDLRSDFVSIEKISIQLAGSTSPDVDRISNLNGRGVWLHRFYPTMGLLVDSSAANLTWEAGRAPDDGDLPAFLSHALSSPDLGIAPPQETQSFPFGVSTVNWSHTRVLNHSNEWNDWSPLLSDAFSIYTERNGLAYPGVVTTEEELSAVIDVTEATLIVEGTLVPEPASLGLLAIGGIVLLGRRR